MWKNILASILAFACIFSGPLGAQAYTDLTPPHFYWDEGDPIPALQRLSSPSGLRVFWWNLEDGMVNRTLSHPSLDENLLTLAHSSLSPDVIVFAEYTENSISKDTQRVLENMYPYIFFQQYNEFHPREGIIVYSRLKFTAEFLGYIDWTPTNLSSNQEKEDYRNQWWPDASFFTRPLLHLSFNINGREVSLLPIHLLDPWRAIRARNGTVKTAEEVLWGKDTPLYYQIIRLREKLSERFGDQMTGSPFLLFGDFNTPKQEGLQTAGYRRLIPDLHDLISGNPRTFPSRSAVERKTFPAVEIDHGFVNSLWRSKAAEVLPLQGSDHYPLYFVMED